MRTGGGAMVKRGYHSKIKDPKWDSHKFYCSNFHPNHFPAVNPEWSFVIKDDLEYQDEDWPRCPWCGEKLKIKLDKTTDSV